MNIKRAASIVIALCCLSLTISIQAQPPQYKFDAEWPKLPLPNQWWMQGVTGLYVDHEDNIWVGARMSPKSKYFKINVRINVKDLDAPEFVSDVLHKAKTIERKSEELERDILDLVDKQL